MFTIFIILLIIAVVLTIIVGMDDLGSGIAVGFIALLLLLIPFFMTFRWQIGEADYTGYIYSRDSQFGYTTYHIRFSENAGEDSQPSFTVAAGSDTEAKLDELVGSGTKVKVHVPSAAPKFVQNIFEPASFAELKQVVKEDK